MTSLGHELSGSLGDLGTFLPLIVALSASIQLDLGTTLALSGLYNIVSGAIYQIPMCVQVRVSLTAVRTGTQPPSATHAATCQYTSCSTCTSAPVRPLSAGTHARACA
jgi:hypothetical protein